MTCIAPPPPAVEATIQVATSPTLAATFVPTPRSRPYVDQFGNLDFNCFATPIRVIFHISPANSGIVFDNGYGGSRKPLSFLDDASDTRPKPRVVDGHHQFKKGINGGGTQTMSFEYHNDWDGGQGNGAKIYLKSRYGIHLARATGYLGEIDPIINNGGNQE
ncbi:MAG: hypothetical protein ACHP84_05950 [Caulobacterales bacterium]